jgi:hypothetical protein
MIDKGARNDLWPSWFERADESEIWQDHCIVQKGLTGGKKEKKNVTLR